MRYFRRDMISVEASNFLIDITVPEVVKMNKCDALEQTMRGTQPILEDSEPKHKSTFPSP